MTPLAAYVLIFLAVAVGFVFVNLLVGKLIRPARENFEKGTIYECGEPTVGSAWVQFDVRYYVVALLFVVFDVEVAFFFPWAEVFGKANNIANQPQPVDVRSYNDYARSVLDLTPPPSNQMQRNVYNRYEALATMTPDQFEEKKGLLKEGEFEQNRQQSRSLAKLALVEILVFFGVLLVGFAYLWKRGDLVWVRSMAAEENTPAGETPAAPDRDRELVAGGKA